MSASARPAASHGLRRSYDVVVSNPTPAEQQYLHGHHESVLRVHSRRTVENSAAYLAPHLSPELHLLDVGSGPGTITKDFARRLHAGRVVGIDAGAEIVARTQAEARDEGLANLEYRTGDVYALDFADNTFDVVHAHQVLQYMADPVAALREMRRVTKPGGLVAVRDVDYGGVRWFPWIDGIEEWRDLYEKVARRGGGEPDAGPQLLDWAQRAGFEQVTATATIWCFADQGERDWWGGSWADRALHSDFARQAVEWGLATPEDLQRISDAWRAWTAAPNGLFNMPHNEILARA
jgi:ubiquinone/menaquinone biosynthesis C-methylase UbiE